MALLSLVLRTPQQHTLARCEILLARQEPKTTVRNVQERALEVGRRARRRSRRLDASGSMPSLLLLLASYYIVCCCCCCCCCAVSNASFQWRAADDTCQA